MSTLDNIKNIHFVGIGGSGMSPLAEILHEQGYHITGSDWGKSDNVLRLEGLGIHIDKGHSADNLRDTQLLVYTSAVSADNPELVAARERGVPMIERGALLGEITKRYDRTFAVAGTHGKTTTSSMLSHALLKADVDASVFIGGRLPLINANGRAGKSDIMVCEACEFQDHYLSMKPAVGIILNVDADHLEYFGSLEGVIASFRKFAQLCDTLIINADDNNTWKAVSGLDKAIITCGTADTCNWQAKNVAFNDAYGEFDCYHDGAFFAHIVLGVPGKHNVSNALTAIAACHLCDVSPEQIVDGIKDFRGAGRRFEFLGTFAGVTVADDYAHHPTEITATLTAAKAMGYNRVWAIFQPFTFSRTARHLDDFAKALSLADTAVVSDIMGSREHNIWNVRSEQITDKMTNGVYLAEFPEITDYILGNVQEGDLVVTMGGGNVYYCARMIVEQLKKKDEN